MNVDTSKDTYPYISEKTEEHMEFNMCTLTRQRESDEQQKFGQVSLMHGVLRTKQPEAISKGFLGSLLTRKPVPALIHSEYYVLSEERGCLDVFKNWNDPKPRVSIADIASY